MKASNKSKWIGWVLATVFLAAILSSCASNTNMGRKCDGRKAIYTPMGPM